MRKRGILLISVLFVSMFFFSFVLADDTNGTFGSICTDNDGGIIYDKQGITTGLDFNNNNTMLKLEDKCFNGTLNVNGSEVPTDNWLLEGYCNGSYAFTTDYLCPYDCVKGACVEEIPINVTCTDSDGGEKYYEKGTTIGMHNGILDWKFTDECFTASGDDNWLLEGYCDENENAYTTDYLCPYGCDDGECLEEEPFNEDCVDSDGLNYFNKGNVQGMHNGNPNWLYEDSCAGDYVVEGYCNAQGAYTTDYLCAYGCDDGACLKTNVGGEINLTSGEDPENSFVKDNWWILLLVGLIVVAFIIMFVVVLRRKK